MSHQQFTCPDCGGHTFGSELAAVSFEILERHCNGYKPDGQGCHFKWKPVDDAKYGLTEEPASEPVVGTTLFEHMVLGDGVVTLDTEIYKYTQMPTEELAKLHDVEVCKVDECLVCGILTCPHKEPLHFHHDGCPACD